jgi:hypothetical protein
MLSITPAVSATPVQPENQSEVFFPFDVTVSKATDQFVREIRVTSPTVTILASDELRVLPDRVSRTVFLPESTTVSVEAIGADGIAFETGRAEVTVTPEQRFIYDQTRLTGRRAVQKVALK